MPVAVADFLVEHLLHVVVGVFLVWFLWKAVRMSVGVQADATGAEADEVAPS